MRQLSSGTEHPMGSAGAKAYGSASAPNPRAKASSRQRTSLAKAPKLPVEHSAHVLVRDVLAVLADRVQIPLLGEHPVA